MSKISIQWVKWSKIGPVTLQNEVLLLIPTPSDNNHRMAGIIIGKNDYFCMVYK